MPTEQSLIGNGFRFNAVRDERRCEAQDLRDSCRSVVSNIPQSGKSLALLDDLINEQLAEPIDVIAEQLSEKLVACGL